MTNQHFTLTNQRIAILPPAVIRVVRLKIPEQDVWAPERLGAGACASEIHSVGHSNVYAITGTHYFHQSNFYFKHHHFHPEKIYLLRIVCIDPASISVKEGLFSSKQHRPLHLEIIHCILANCESSFHFS